MATPQQCAYCFKLIHSVLTSSPKPSFQCQQQAPLFVTWTTIKDDQLRGCIGTFKADKLNKLLPQYAMISAFSDTRFKPIALKQLPNLSVAKKGKKALEWQVGKHGIIIQFQLKGQFYNATYLPQVAKQQGWDQMTTLKHLIRKSGYTGSIQKIIPEIELTTYESSKCKMSFDQWPQSKQVKI